MPESRTLARYSIDRMGCGGIGGMLSLMCEDYFVGPKISEYVDRRRLRIVNYKAKARPQVVICNH